ncbi:MAG: rRNA pseudouridine synthase [Armatimonadetes bacterium]|nr:rRNA pseudouridine synthase [Armatimonadota bacterium]
MQRLSKVVAASGVTSRRKAADVIRAGRVQVDGETVREPGRLVDPQTARVEVDGVEVRSEAKYYFLVHKPRGPISAAADDRGRKTVLDLLPDVPARLYPAGRLDADTEGLLLVTNDGELTYRLTHPRYEVAKVYEAAVRGRPSREDLAQLERGMELEEGPTGPAEVEVLQAGRDASVIQITVHAGRKRMVRRMFAAIGHPVVALRRTRLGPLALGELKPGESRPLTEAELAALQEAVGERADQNE